MVLTGSTCGPQNLFTQSTQPQRKLWKVNKRGWMGTQALLWIHLYYEVHNKMFLCFSSLLDPPAWCSGPAGWRVLVPPGNRPLVCREAVRRARRPSKILPFKAATRGSWLLHHSLCWQGIAFFLFPCLFYHPPRLSSFPRTENRIRNVPCPPSCLLGGLQGKWLAGEEHGSSERQRGLSSAPVIWSFCIRAVEGRWDGFTPPVHSLLYPVNPLFHALHIYPGWE